MITFVSYIRYDKQCPICTTFSCIGGMTLVEVGKEMTINNSIITHNDTADENL